MDLDVIYQRHIRGTMEAADLGEQKTKVFENRYQWVLALALCLFFLELMLPEKAAAVLMMAILAAAAPEPAGAADLKTSLDQAEAAYGAGEYDAAVQHYISAQLEAPGKAEIAYNMGNAQYRAEDYDGAIISYGQVLASEDVTLQEKAHYNMGNTYFRKGDLDKAIESYEAALTLDENDAQARENLAFAKKVKENPPQQSPEGDQDEQQEQNDRQDPEENRQPDDQEESDSGEQGDSGDEQGEENPEDRQQQEPSPDENRQPSSESKEEEKGAGGEQTPATPDEETLRQAEKMLNRLQDQPGRAMVPAYRDRQVEQDW
jgi:Ca-activated chloride channel family protein